MTSLEPEDAATQLRRAIAQAAEQVVRAAPDIDDATALLPALRAHVPADLQRLLTPEAFDALAEHDLRNALMIRLFRDD
ncbi:hypothetical protein [Deinococcus ruber]|uniref:Uncharacterized protein n=1 Tax=Deinococcus ruber TaxID=1848197 RepID=A0A918F6G1_9DEIO|nr:hypothetical protein [Deinococcus ruber]GGR13047.1 hypothetical protein GCM10008957_27500 [Deinococcus ruber]